MIITTLPFNVFHINLLSNLSKSVHFSAESHLDISSEAKQKRPDDTGHSQQEVCMCINLMPDYFSFSCFQKVNQAK